MRHKAVDQRLAEAAASAIPSYAGMFANVREGAAPTRNDKTNPLVSPPAGAASNSFANAPPLGAGTSAEKGEADARGRAGMCGNVRKDAAQTGNGKANPFRSDAALTPRQVAAARLLALGRCGRAVAAEVGVNEHTVTRWRRGAAFAAEVRRQHELILAEQCRQRRAEQVDAFAATAERIARKYGMGR